MPEHPVTSSQAGSEGDAPQGSASLRIVVMGYIVRGPIGGMAWHYLNYVLGLRKLGYDVLYLEDSDDYPSCYDPQRHETGTDPACGLRFTGATFARLGLDPRWAYFDQHEQRWHGPFARDAAGFCESADVLLNISVVTPLQPWTARIPVRALIDTDPLFTQVRHLRDERALRRAEQHNAFFTFAQNIGKRGCTVPDDGLPWWPTRQPIALDAWRVTAPPPDGRFTTVMQWDSYPPVEHAGRQFGNKSMSFAPYLDLPRRTDAPLELALGSPHAPRDQLRELGWGIEDPLAVTADPWTYQRYIAQSLGEFSVAKHGYVASRSGWFSERTACYLASGRPAIVQDTGFSESIPTGEGLLAFSSADQAVRALQVVRDAWPHHGAQARKLAESVFDARRVLDELMAALR